jgi:hypothetical protein
MRLAGLDLVFRGGTVCIPHLLDEAGCSSIKIFLQRAVAIAEATGRSRCTIAGADWTRQGVDRPVLRYGYSQPAAVHAGQLSAGGRCGRTSI